MRTAGVLIAIALVACGGGEARSFAASEVEDAIADHLVMQGFSRIPFATCPAGERVKVGGTMTCQVKSTADDFRDEVHPVAVTVKAARGEDLEIVLRPTDGTVITALIAGEVAGQLAEEANVRPTVDCGPAVYTRLPADRRLRCTATVPGNSARTYDVDVVFDAAGNPTSTLR